MSKVVLFYNEVFNINFPPFSKEVVYIGMLIYVPDLKELKDDIYLTHKPHGMQNVIIFKRVLLKVFSFFMLEMKKHINFHYSFWKN